ncbi:MAG TPA: urea ABC transporter ATP-binding subunit UrtE [Fibrobacteria bacterium]|nr:urea ABC transporter ATP-binding subunit UrtE [Fibrobacteria bacterium]
MTAILSTSGLSSGYGTTQVLSGIDLEVPEGSITAVLGRNGVGKTTLMKTLAGVLPALGGTTTYRGRDITKDRADARARAGIGLVPQGREIFSRLTVAENLELALDARRDRSPVPWERILGLFPVLGQMRRRQGGNLSGGQQQQLAIARALVGDPSVLMLDEPTEGIQPNIVQDIQDTLRKLRDEGGLTIVLVEQYLDFALEVANHICVMDRGTVVLSGSAADLDPDEIRHHLTV